MTGKRGMTAVLIGCLALTPALGGCVGTVSDEMLEYKEEGIARMEEGDYDGALTSFRAALDESVGLMGAEELDICYYRALALFLSGDTEGALAAYTALVEYDEDNWELYYLRGNVYLKNDQDSEALADYAQAAELDAKDPELCVHIYENLANAGLADEAQTYADTARTMKPSSAEDYYYLGEIDYLTGDYESAKEQLTTAQEKGYEDAILLLGSIYADTGDSETAQSLFEEYMTQHPDDPASLAKLGEMALTAGEYDQAIEYLTRAKEGADDTLLVSITKNLIAAYEYAEDFESAYEVASDYLTAHTNEEIQRECDFLATRVGALP